MQHKAKVFEKKFFFKNNPFYKRKVEKSLYK